MSKKLTYFNNVIPENIRDYLRGYIVSVFEDLHPNYAEHGISREDLWKLLNLEMNKKFKPQWEKISQMDQLDFFYHVLKLLAHQRKIGSYREGKNTRMYCGIKYEDQLAYPGKYMYLQDKD